MSIDFNSLTSKQKKVYLAIEAFIKQKGIPPTVRELGEMMGEKTPGAIQGILNRLEQKGAIKREVGMARSIQLVSGNERYIGPIYIPYVKKISDRNIDDLFNIYNVHNYQPISPDFIQGNENCFLIDCPDNSMNDSGIRSDDILIICRSTSIKDNSIVLALYDNFVLLRKCCLTDNPSTIKLVSGDSLIDKEIFNENEILIVGILIGKYSKF